MRNRNKIITMIFILVFAVTATWIYEYQSDYVNTVEEAINKANIEYNEIYQVTERKGYHIILYGKDDVLSAGIIEKTIFGYKWIFGIGSKQFNENGIILTKAWTNLPRKTEGDDPETISLNFGVIYENSIEKLKIKYRDQEWKDALIIPISRGRIWYCFSDTPISYDPDVLRINKNGEETPGWY